MDKAITGIHHVTAIGSDPQKNLDFYSGLLGLPLVKITANFDDPTRADIERALPRQARERAAATAWRRQA